jgi:uroporphyrinogen-III synthase
MTRHDDPAPLAGRRIAVPESRQLDVLDGLLSRRGADVLRCPLLAIVDAPDAGPVLNWLRDFIARPPDYFIAMTGEGLARLRGFAEGGGRRKQVGNEAFCRALGQTTLVSRGPKPARELRRYGLVPDLFAPAATTEGVIELLEGIDIEGRRVAVQLYGDDPNKTLIDYLHRRACKISPVAPYRYAARLSRDAILELAGELEQGRLDAIVFTSKSQVERLFDVVTATGQSEKLRKGLRRSCVAAIGPVVAAALAAQGCRADVMPEERYFMKPLVQSLSHALRRRAAGSSRVPRECRPPA